MHAFATSHWLRRFVLRGRGDCADAADGAGSRAAVGDLAGRRSLRVRRCRSGRTRRSRSTPPRGCRRTRCIARRSSPRFRRRTSCRSSSGATAHAAWTASCSSATSRRSRRTASSSSSSGAKDFREQAGEGCAPRRRPPAARPHLHVGRTAPRPVGGGGTGAHLIQAIDWGIKENTRAGSPLARQDRHRDGRDDGSVVRRADGHRSGARSARRYARDLEQRRLQYRHGEPHDGDESDASRRFTRTPRTSTAASATSPSRTRTTMCRGSTRCRCSTA